MHTPAESARTQRASACCRPAVTMTSETVNLEDAHVEGLRQLAGRRARAVRPRAPAHTRARPVHAHARPPWPPRRDRPETAAAPARAPRHRRGNDPAGRVVDELGEPGVGGADDGSAGGHCFERGVRQVLVPAWNGDDSSLLSQTANLGPAHLPEQAARHAERRDAPLKPLVVRSPVHDTARAPGQPDLEGAHILQTGRGIHEHVGSLQVLEPTREQHDRLGLTDRGRLAPPCEVDRKTDDRSRIQVSPPRLGQLVEDQLRGRDHQSRAFDDVALQPRSRADVACERATAVTAGDGKRSV